MKKIRVLIVDDSAFMRKVLRDILISDPDIEVIDVARDGKEAVEKALNLLPDVITMDVEMPVMTGIQAVEEIMSKRPIPIIMVSAYTLENASITLEALEKGAMDFVTKPGGPISVRIRDVRDEIIKKVKAVSQVNIHALRAKLKDKKVRTGKRSTGWKLVVIASSTGGPRALFYVIPRIPDNLEASIIVVQHMPEGFTGPFAQRLAKRSALPVKEAVNGEKLEKSCVYVAPSGYHLKLERDFSVKLTKESPMHGVRPAADITMISVASVAENSTIGVVMTGMGKDGAMGVKEIKARGGKVIAQDRETSVIYGMPKAAVETGCVDLVLPLEEIPGGIVRMVKEYD